jgi:hypothetical protein
VSTATFHLIAFNTNFGALLVAGQGSNTALTLPQVLGASSRKKVRLKSFASANLDATDCLF